MAKVKKEAKEADNKGEAKVKAASKGGGLAVKVRTGLFMLFFLVLSVFFLSSALIFCVGMLPTFVAFFTDRSYRKSKAVTVGSFNLAGCVPFVLELWKTGRTMDNAIDIISEPMTVVIIYVAAAAGYFMEWMITQIVSNIMYQQGLARRKAITKRQEDLVERWGREVTGEIAVDKDGFAVEDEDDELP